MRLLNTHTLTLSSFYGSAHSLPPYAILSHTWAPDGEEITFQDVQDGLLHAAQPPLAKAAGLAKLHGCCARARLDGYAWAWIDTCCIDKASSAELSEAINSMFAWYRAAGVCYAHLADVHEATTGPFLGSGDAAVVAEFRASRWFTRGWTLQELIAPERVEFFSSGWSELGTKMSLEGLVAEVTGIEPRALRGTALSNFTAATRMRWASGRRTTREEDVAYCLLGLFDVNMPLLYGEGARAFQRLQEEIFRNYGDYTILAWPGGSNGGGGGSTSAISALAESPEDFAGPLSFPADVSGELRDRLTRLAWGNLRDHKPRRKNYTAPMVVSLGLLLTLPVRLIEANRGFKRFLVSTECAIYLDGRVLVLCIDLRAYPHPYIEELMILQRSSKSSPNPSCLQAIDEADLMDMQLMQMYLPRPREPSPTLRLQPTRSSLLHLVLPDPQSPSTRVTLIGTIPKLLVATAPLSLRNSTQPGDAVTFFHLAYSVGLINISVSTPGGPCFSILYHAGVSRHQPVYCIVLPSSHIVLQDDSFSVVQAILLTALQAGPRTDRATRSFPEHGLKIHASIKVIPGGGDMDSPAGPCIRVAIHACPLVVEEVLSP